MNGGFHPQDCVARLLYVCTKSNGWKWADFKQGYCLFRKVYYSSEEKLLKTVRKIEVKTQEMVTSFKTSRKVEDI